MNYKFILGLLIAGSLLSCGIFDKVQQKVEQKVEEKIDKAIDDAVNKVDSTVSKMTVDSIKTYMQKSMDSTYDKSIRELKEKTKSKK